MTLKIAQTIDGKTAAATGESKWITGPEARRFGHLLRARHDAILIGIGTALADDPELTCRLPGLEDRSPLRVVLDTRLKLTEWSKLAQTPRDCRRWSLRRRGAAGWWPAGSRSPRSRATCAVGPIWGGAADLARRGITRLLVEGGATVHAAFLDRGLADRLEVFRAPLYWALPAMTESIRWPR